LLATCFGKDFQHELYRMTKVTSLQHILYDPCGWIHPGRFVLPKMLNSAGCQSVFNTLLIRHYGLSVDHSEISVGSITEAIVENWLILPHVVFLLACKQYRAPLLYQGEFRHMEKYVQDFCSHPSANEQPIRICQPVTLDILMAGSLQILMGFNKKIPQSLIQRIPLLFDEKHLQLNSFNFLSEVSTIDFKLAIQYAKNHYLP